MVAGAILLHMAAAAVHQEVDRGIKLEPEPVPILHPKTMGLPVLSVQAPTLLTPIKEEFKRKRKLPTAHVQSVSAKSLNFVIRLFGDISIETRLFLFNI